MNKLLLGSALIILLGGILVIIMISKDGQTEEAMVVDEVVAVSDRTVKTTSQTAEDANSMQPASQSLTLDYSGQNLTKAPAVIFTKTKTEKLDLSHNQITGALQAEVRNLSSLRILDLSDNRFTGVPAEIGQLKDLEILDLSNNQLTGLPYELGNLQNLKQLDLRGNNYATADLEIIKKNLPSSVDILTN